MKESIFRLEASELERVFIRAAAERASVDEYLHPTPDRPTSVEVIIILNFPWIFEFLYTYYIF